MDEEDQDLDEQRRLRERAQELRTQRVAASVKNERGTRETARLLGLSKTTVVRHRRLAGLTPKPPLRHLGGGRWEKAR